MTQLQHPRDTDSVRINVQHPHEMDYWVRTLGCPPKDLQAAVAAVGMRLADVRRHLELAARQRRTRKP